MRPTSLLPCLLALLAACRAVPGRLDLSDPWVPPVKDAIVICGEKVRIGAPVVLWHEFPGYDAARTAFFGAPPADLARAPTGLRYQPGRVRRTSNPDFVAPPEEGPDTRDEAQRSQSEVEFLVRPDARDARALERTVDQLVLHYDVCGVSRTCFQVLHDQRGLSAHFLLDIDGTLYQTLDLRDQAFHATKANPRSIGIEIAHVGAYPPGRRSLLDEWYGRDEGGPFIRIPARLEGGGVRTPGFVGRPARPERVAGEIQGQQLEMFDFTPQQYASLVALTAALCRELPLIRPDAPRDESGAVRTRVLGDTEWLDFQGILGHHHVQANKIDPGPAFDWERFLADVRARLPAP